jgi:hypothetical protein
VPQGGGDHRTGHRCPGEWITLALLETAADAFARRLEYAVPRQDLRIDFGRLPALPRSGFAIARVRPMRPASRSVPRGARGLTPAGGVGDATGVTRPTGDAPAAGTTMVGAAPPAGAAARSAPPAAPRGRYAARSAQ